MTKQEQEKEIKLIRSQLYNLKLEGEQREERIVKFMTLLSPFFNLVSPQIHKQLQELTGKDEEE